MGIAHSKEQKISANSNLASVNSPSSSLHSARVNNSVDGSQNLTAGGNIIQNNYCTHSISNQVSTFRLIDKPTPYFTGREELIAKIHHLLKECTIKTDYEERIVVLRGFGGMGKSELARKYVVTHINDPIIMNVAWINAETKDSTKKSFKSLAKYLKLTHEEEDPKLLAQEFYRHFSNHVKTGLIIFDNVEQLRDRKPYHGIFDYLPTQQLDHVPLILITSRINDWQIPLEDKYILEISGLCEEAAVKFLFRSWKLDDHMQNDSGVSNAVHRLAKSVEGYPLGLTLASSTITSYGSEDIQVNINNYIIRLDASKQDWIKDELSAGSATNYKLLMSAVWDATIEKIKAVEKDWHYALELLSIMAYYPADDIFLTDICKLFVNVFNLTVSDIHKGMHILKSYSLISFSAQHDHNHDHDKCIQIHRHIQRCTRTMLELANDYSYLGVVVSYRKNRKQIEKTKIFQISLKQWPWMKAVVREFIFLLYNVIFLDDMDMHAWEMTQCLNKVCSLHLYEAEDFVTLYYLCLFYLRNKNSKVDHNHVDGFRKNNTREEMAFLSAAKFVFKTEETLVDVFIDSDVKYSVMNLFQNELRTTNFYNGLTEDVKTKFGDILVAFANSSVSNHLANALMPFYHYLSLFYQDDACICANKYLAAAIKSYNQVNYMKSLFGYFPFDSLRKFFDVEDPNWTFAYSAFVSTFLKQGGLGLVVNEIRHTYSYCFLDALLPFIVQMTCYEDCSTRLVMEVDFMDQLKIQTRAYFELKGANLRSAFLFLLTWLGIFSSNRTMKDPKEKKWSIKSVDEEIKLFLNLYKTDEKINRIIIGNFAKKNFKIWTLESILKPYITSPPGVYEISTVELANLLRHTYLEQ